MRAAAVFLAGLAACDLVDGGAAMPDAALDAPASDAYRPPRGDVVPALGSPATLDVACWNIENFPATPTTPAYVADLITSLDLDLVVTEEIASVAAWNELLDRLPAYAGVLSTHAYTPTSYQKIGLIYRVGAVTVGSPELLFVTDTYGFPRPPLRVPVTVGALTVDVIGVHLKAGSDGADSDRRAAAARALDTYLRGHLAGAGDPDFVVLGDYNDTLTEGAQALAPLLATDVYRMRTAAAAGGGAASFLPSGKVIDHILTSVALDATIGERDAVIPPLAEQFPGYQDLVSDHLPVVLSIPGP
jgi:endonuclease/exonuclease/phosphatase family metal-dependent hydrolase